MSVKTTPDQHQSNLRNVYGTFAIEGMTISKDTRRNLDRMVSQVNCFLIIASRKHSFRTVVSGSSPPMPKHCTVSCLTA